LQIENLASLCYLDDYLMNRSKKIKDDFEFYKGITEKLGVALNITEVVDRKYLKTLWGNNKYIKILGKSIEERNSDIKKCHEEFCANNALTDLNDLLPATLDKNESFSALYKHHVPTGLHHWVLTLIKPFKRESNEELKLIVCASFDLLIEGSHLQQYEKLQKEIAQLKNKLVISELSKKEIEILQLLSSGNGEKEIAEAQSRSLHTIKTHIKNIRKKLSLKKNTELVNFAMESGIV
jgi:DNA-binding CsgD family transcriptional regulator